MRVLRRHKTVHKITHPVKQQDLGMLGFQLEILLHHGRMGIEIFYCTHGVMSGSLILNGV